MTARRPGPEVKSYRRAEAKLRSHIEYRDPVSAMLLDFEGKNRLVLERRNFSNVPLR